MTQGENIRLQCGACGARVMGLPKHVGATLTCPKCGQKAEFKAAEAAAPSDALAAVPRPAAKPPTTARPALPASVPVPASHAEVPPPSEPEEYNATACPSCGAAVGAGLELCAACGHVMGGGGGDASEEPAVQGLSRSATSSSGRTRAAQAAAAGRMGLAVAIGCGAAVLCGVVWALIAMSGFEIGYVAWGIGGVCGFVVTRITPQRGMGVGLSASGLAVLGILIGKLLTVQWAAVPAIAKDLMKNKEVMTSLAYARLVERGEVDPKVVEWIANKEEGEDPPGELREKIEASDIKVAEELRGMSPQKKIEMVTPVAEMVLDNVSYAERIQSQLGLFDILWMFLAVGTAWKMGVG